MFSHFWMSPASVNLVGVHNKLHGDFAENKGCIWKKGGKDSCLINSCKNIDAFTFFPKKMRGS